MRPAKTQKHYSRTHWPTDVIRILRNSILNVSVVRADTAHGVWLFSVFPENQFIIWMTGNSFWNYFFFLCFSVSFCFAVNFNSNEFDFKFYQLHSHSHWQIWQITICWKKKIREMKNPQNRNENVKNNDTDCRLNITKLIVKCNFHTLSTVRRSSTSSSHSRRIHTAYGNTQRLLVRMNARVYIATKN